MAGCTDLTVGTIEKRYGCVNGTCTEQADGAYTEPTCAGACSVPTPSNNSTLLILGAAGIGALLLFGRNGGK